MSIAASPLRLMLQRVQRGQAERLAIASLSAAGAATAAVVLLSLSGWFLTAAALAGAAGPAAALAFNYLLPSAAIRFLAVARTGLRYTERLVGHSAALHALAEVRPALFTGLAAAPAARALELSSGEAASRLVRDVDALESVFVRQAAPRAALTAAAAATVLTFIANPLAALVFLAAFSALIVIGAWVGRVRCRAPAGRALQAMGALKDGVQAVCAASAELRCYGFTHAAVESLMSLDDQLGAARRLEWTAFADLGALQPALTGVVVAALLALCAHASPPLASLAALSAAVALESASGVLQSFDRTGAVETATRRLEGMLDTSIGQGGDAPIDKRSLISLRITGRDWCLAPGGRWALVGPSGVGKTRLLEALLGLRELRGDEIEIGGQPLAALDVRACRSLFAYAPQDARMITGTVRENLAIGDPSASETVMFAALASAQLAEKVGRMQHGLDTWIGEGGAMLSGGEQRRLSLARALLRPAPWLLLDEPTEGLDAAAEARVVDALAAHLAKSRQGLILVSHRPAPLGLCNGFIPLSFGAASPARPQWIVAAPRLTPSPALAT